VGVDFAKGDAGIFNRIYMIHFGTFDVDNFGDVLYPLLLRRLLKQQTIIAGFRETHVPLGNYSTIAIEKVIEQRPMIIGGGDLLRDDCDRVAEHYRMESLPIELKHSVGIDGALYCSVGCPWPIKSTIVSPFVWMRDHKAADNYGDACHVAPDLVCAVSDCYPRQVQADFALIQMVVPTPEARQALRQLSKRYRLLLCPVNYYAGDEANLTKLAQQDGYELIVPRSVEQIISLANQAQLVVSSSMHLGITAFSYGVPFLFAPLEQTIKRSGFLDVVGLPQDMELQQWSDLDPARCFVSEDLVRTAKAKVYDALNHLLSHVEADDPPTSSIGGQ
jgi:hypothetical protein